MATRLFFPTLFSILALACLATPVPAGVGDLLGCLDQTGCCDRCPACGYVCELKSEVVDAKRDCFEVESKVICIPRVVFPWQRSQVSRGCGQCDGGGCGACSHNGARLRTVCVLKPDSYTCPECEYSWKAKKRGSSCATGCGELPSGWSEAWGQPGSMASADHSATGDIAEPWVPSDDAAPTESGDASGSDGDVLVPVEVSPPAGMEEALQFPTPLRPAQ